MPAQSSTSPPLVSPSPPEQERAGFRRAFRTARGAVGWWLMDAAASFIYWASGAR